MATRNALALGALVLGTAGVAAYASAAHANPAHSTGAAPAGTVSTVVKCGAGTPTVTLQGTGTANGTPDQVVVSLGIQTEAPTAAAAIGTNNTKAAAVVAKLESDGVPKSDLQTSNLSVQANYNNNGTVILNYQVDNDITVTLDDIALTGTVVDDAASAAGDAIRVQGISFAVQDQTALASEALAAAVRQAATEAQAMASAAGVTLGPLCSLQDNSSVTPVQPLFAAGVPSASATTTPVEAGSFQVTANITAVYELGPSSGATTASIVRAHPKGVVS